jgi:glutathione S-transferase
MLTLWGRRNSINVQKVAWTLDELGLKYRRIDAGGPFGGLDQPGYGALNPNRRIPVLEDGAVVVWESNAIVRYLAARYGEGSLWAADPGARARADMWMDWQQTVLQPDLGPLFVALIRTPPEQRDAAALARLAERVTTSLEALETQLQRQAFVAGEAFSMGDIPVGAAVWRWNALPLVTRPAMPAIAAWQARLMARPGFREQVAQPLS